jgi:hypothetical protein
MKNPKLDLTPNPIMEIRQPAMMMMVGERQELRGDEWLEGDIIVPFAER